MPILLYRVDERLIHGQVIVGWGNFLKINEIFLINDQIAQNLWERELYLASVPQEMKGFVLKISEAKNFLSENNNSKRRGIVLVESPFDILKLLDLGVSIKSLNLGGMHSKPERAKVLSYLYISLEEKEAFKKIMEKGIDCFCQDVPFGEKKNLKDLI
jgi:mannose/fructose/N-acetylgalactosamine-specific phosphotransferase system component IIB